MNDYSNVLQNYGIRGDSVKSQIRVRKKQTVVSRLLESVVLHYRSSAGTLGSNTHTSTGNLRVPLLLGSSLAQYTMPLSVS